MIIKKTTFILIATICLMISPSTLLAKESKVIGGIGLWDKPGKDPKNPDKFNPLAQDKEYLKSIWRIGICEITPGDELGYEAAQRATDSWANKFAETNKFKIVRIPGDCNPSVITPNDIVEICKNNKVDCLLWGKVVFAKARFRDYYYVAYWEVKLGIAYFMWEGKTGQCIWDRELRKEGSAHGFGANQHPELMLRRYAGDIGADCVTWILRDGFTGKDLEVNEKPAFEFPEKALNLVTSAYHLKLKVTDDYAVCNVALSCGQQEPLVNWPVDSLQVFDVDIILKSDQLISDQLYVIAKDSLGAESQLCIPIIKSPNMISGQIAYTSAESIFINIGSDIGVFPGMVFTVEKEVKITDPVTGQVLDNYSVECGLIEVVEAKPSSSVCKVIKGNYSDMTVGCRVY